MAMVLVMVVMTLGMAVAPGPVMVFHAKIMHRLVFGFRRRACLLQRCFLRRDQLASGKVFELQEVELVDAVRSVDTLRRRGSEKNTGDGAEHQRYHLSIDRKG
jgi:hypothetical protein